MRVIRTGQGGPGFVQKSLTWSPHRSFTRRSSFFSALKTPFFLGFPAPSLDAAAATAAMICGRLRVGGWLQPRIGRSSDRAGAVGGSSEGIESCGKGRQRCAGRRAAKKDRVCALFCMLLSHAHRYKRYDVHMYIVHSTYLYLCTCIHSIFCPCVLCSMYYVQGTCTCT